MHFLFHIFTKCSANSVGSLVVDANERSEGFSMYIHQLLLVHSNRRTSSFFLTIFQIRWCHCRCLFSKFLAIPRSLTPSPPNDLSCGPKIPKDHLFPRKFWAPWKRGNINDRVTALDRVKNEDLCTRSRRHVQQTPPTKSKSYDMSTRTSSS